MRFEQPDARPIDAQQNVVVQHPLVFSNIDNFGKSYIGHLKGALTDQNKEIVSRRASSIGKLTCVFAKEKNTVNLSCTSVVVNTHVDAVWESLNMTFRSSDKIMNV